MSRSEHRNGAKGQDAATATFRPAGTRPSAEAPTYTSSQPGGLTSGQPLPPIASLTETTSQRGRDQHPPRTNGTASPGGVSTVEAGKVMLPSQTQLETHPRDAGHRPVLELWNRASPSERPPLGPISPRTSNKDRRSEAPTTRPSPLTPHPLSSFNALSSGPQQLPLPSLPPASHTSSAADSRQPLLPTTSRPLNPPQYHHYSQTAPGGMPMGGIPPPTTAPGGMHSRAGVDPTGSNPVSLAGSSHYVTLETEQGPLSVPIDVQAASRVADEKRRRNAGASARFRARRKEKEQASTREIDTLKEQIADLAEDMSFYRHERDYLATALYNTSERDRHFPRPASPRRHRGMQRQLPDQPATQVQGPFEEQGIRGTEGRHTRRRLSQEPPQLPSLRQPLLPPVPSSPYLAFPPPHSQPYQQPQTQALHSPTTPSHRRTQSHGTPTGNPPVSAALPSPAGSYFPPIYPRPLQHLPSLPPTSEAHQPPAPR